MRTSTRASARWVIHQGVGSCEAGAIFFLNFFPNLPPQFLLCFQLQIQYSLS